jgi:drug/metabolite transporter (DMT)-like permease
MTWLWTTLGAIFLLVFSTYVDKYLLTRYFKGRDPGVLILFSAFFGVIATPIIYVIEPAALAIPFWSGFWLTVGGLGSITGTILYLYAMNIDEVSVVVPLFQLAPVFNFVFGYLFLHEVLHGYQLVGFVVVFIGSVIVSLDFSRGMRMPKFKARVFFLMAGATCLISINTVIFKSIAIEETFWVSQFWEYAALVLAGFVLFVTIKKYREQFLGVFRKNKVPIISLNVLNEITGAAGYLLLSYASLLAPIAIVSVVSSTQPLFLFIFGALITIFLPAIAQEDVSKPVITQKVIAALIIFFGGYLLNIGF